MKQTLEKFPTNTFYYYANEYRKHITEEDEIEKIDMTAQFYQELEIMIKKGEIIKIYVTSKPREGKSTVGLTLGPHILNLQKTHGQAPKEAEFTLNNVARDQQEFSRLVRNEKTSHTTIVIDEFNSLENTGESVTAENALRNDYSDIFAAKYVHTIWHSPREIADPNADIILQVVSKNHQTKTTHCKLYYKYREGGFEDTKLLGYVNIYVGNTIKQWDKIKPLFYKPNRTEEDNKIIEETAKKDFYTNYVIKKHEKMDVLIKEGIFRPRLLDFAEPILKTVEDLKNLTKNMKPIDKTLVQNILTIKIREAKLVTSIFGDDYETRHALGILNSYVQYHKINKDIQNNYIKHEKEKIDNETYENKRKELLDIQTTIGKAIQMQIQELETCISINKQYHTKE